MVSFRLNPPILKKFFFDFFVTIVCKRLDFWGRE